MHVRRSSRAVVKTRRCHMKSSIYVRACSRVCFGSRLLCWYIFAGKTYTIPKRPIMSLTDTKVRSLNAKKAQDKVTDGEGLYLLINPSGGKLWRLASLPKFPWAVMKPSGCWPKGQIRPRRRGLKTRAPHCSGQYLRHCGGRVVRKQFRKVGRVLLVPPPQPTGWGPSSSSVEPSNRRNHTVPQAR